MKSSPSDQGLALEVFRLRMVMSDGCPQETV